MLLRNIPDWNNCSICTCNYPIEKIPSYSLNAVNSSVSRLSQYIVVCKHQNCYIFRDIKHTVSTWLDGLGWMSRLPNELRSFAGTGQGRKLVFFYALFVCGNMSIYFSTYNTEQDKSHRSTCPMALLFYAVMVSTLLLYAFNLVGILVALLGRSATKIILLIIRIMMCQIKKGFLTFYFSPQFFIGRKIQLVFRSEELFISVQDRIFCNIFIRVRAENNSQRRIVIRS